MALTPKQQAFVGAYLISLNAAGAARAAGYSEKTSKQAGFRLLQDPEVAAAIRAAREVQQALHDVSLDRLVRELAAIALVDPRALHDWGPDGVVLKPSSALTDSEARAVAEVSQTVTPAGKSLSLKTHGKLQAIAQLTRLLGLGAEHAPVDADDGEDIADDEDPPVAPE